MTLLRVIYGVIIKVCTLYALLTRVTALLEPLKSGREIFWETTPQLQAWYHRISIINIHPIYRI